MRKFLVAAVLVLSGCATQQQQVKDPRVSAFWLYVNTQKPLAEAGALKWSDYYSGLYTRHQDLAAPPEVLRAVNDLRWAAQQSEAGRITKDEFDYRQRDLRAQLEIISRQQAEAQAQAQAEQAESAATRLALAAKIMQGSQPAVLTPYTLPTAPAPTPPAMLAGFLQTQSINGTLKYCKYSNGVVTTINVIDLCPLNSR